MENKYPDIPDELITKLRKEFDEGITAAEEGFFVAGIQFGVCLMHVALG